MGWYKSVEVRAFPDDLLPGHVIEFTPKWDGDTERAGMWAVMGFRYDECGVRGIMHCLDLRSIGRSVVHVIDIKSLVELRDGTPPYRKVGKWDNEKSCIRWGDI